MIKDVEIIPWLGHDSGSTKCKTKMIGKEEGKNMIPMRKSLPR